MPEDTGQDSPEEGVSRILDEILLANQWQRPSLIMAVYRSEHTKEKILRQIALPLTSAGLDILHYRVDRNHYDIPRDLLEFPHHEQTIFHIHGLRWGGGRGYSNAYRALNMHREYLVEGSIKAIFWLTKMEARQVSRFAPDFWAFRHQAVEFLDLPAAMMTPASSDSKKLPPDQQDGKTANLEERCRRAEEMVSLGCLEDALDHYRGALRKYPEMKAIYLRTATIHLAMGRLPAAKNALRKVTRDELPSSALLEEYEQLKNNLRNTPPSPGGLQERLT